MPTEKGPDTYELNDTEICAVEMAVEGILFEEGAAKSSPVISFRQFVNRLAFIAKIRRMLTRFLRDPSMLRVIGEEAGLVKESIASEIHRLQDMVLASEADAKFACTHTVQEHCDALIAVWYVFPNSGDKYVN